MPDPRDEALVGVILSDVLADAPRSISIALRLGRVAPRPRRRETDWEETLQPMDHLNNSTDMYAKKSSEYIKLNSSEFNQVKR